MTRRKKILNFAMLSDILTRAGNGFIHSSRGYYGPNGIPGEMFVLEKLASVELANQIASYDNVFISECSVRYAPEIKHTTVFICDR